MITPPKVPAIADTALELKPATKNIVTIVITKEITMDKNKGIKWKKIKRSPTLLLAELYFIKKSMSVQMMDVCLNLLH